MEKKRDKMGGVGFYLVLMCAFLKDISDLILNAFVVTAPLTILTGGVMSAILWGYLTWNGVSINSRKLASFVISSIIDVVPFLGFLPASTINLFIIRNLERKGL